MTSNFHILLVLVCVVPLGAVSTGCAPEKPSEARLSGDIDRSDEAAGKKRPSAEIEKEVVVRVDGEEISLGEFNRRLQEMPEFARARFSTTEQKQSYLDSVAQFELMADVAETQGFGERAEVVYALESALADRLVEQVIGQKLSMDDIEDQAIERYYDDHPDEFRTPEGRRVALIRVATRPQAVRLRPQVLEAMDSAEDSAINAFRRQAEQHSTDRVVAKKGGDIGFVAPDVVETSDAETIAQQVFALGKIGEVTPVFAVDDGFALATFLERRKASVVSLAEASGEIRAKLYEQRKRQIERDLVAELRQSANIERVAAAMKQAKVSPRPGARRVEDVVTYEVAPSDTSEDGGDKEANEKSNETNVSDP
jgi:hypothetical protein